jgi:hypothetical protein
MKKIIFLTSALLLSLSTVVSSNQSLLLDKKVTNSPVLKWYSANKNDVIQLTPGANDVYLLITNDHITNGHLGCTVNVTGCQANLLGLSAGDAALCEPKEATQGVQIVSSCNNGEDPYTDASGTYQFLMKK